MRYFNRLLSGLLILCLAMFLLVGCVPKSEDEPSPPIDATQPQPGSQEKIELQILQAEYDKLSGKYDYVKSELEKAEAKYGEISAKHDELSAKYYQLSAKHDELSAEYEELSAKYDAVMQGTRGINEEDVEQAIFELINQERRNNELDELEWSNGLHWWAKDHSEYMATIKRLEYSDRDYWQDNFRAVGYSTVDRIANAAFLLWEESLRYESNFLDKAAKYCAVGVSKSGEIFYITYFAHIYK